MPTTEVQQYVGEKPDLPITLVIYTGKDGQYESLYEDDGLTMAYQRGAYSRIPISYDNASGRVVIGARSGRFDGMVDKRVFKVRFIGVPRQAHRLRRRGRRDGRIRRRAGGGDAEVVSFSPCGRREPTRPDEGSKDLNAATGLAVGRGVFRSRDPNRPRRAVAREPAGLSFVE
ncbi:DUF5110 domain-containing protein [Caulobacter segnis]